MNFRTLPPCACTADPHNLKIIVEKADYLVAGQSVRQRGEIAQVGGHHDGVYRLGVAALELPVYEALAHIVVETSREEVPSQFGGVVSISITAASAGRICSSRVVCASVRSPRARSVAQATTGWRRFHAVQGHCQVFGAAVSPEAHQAAKTR